MVNSFLHEHKTKYNIEFEKKGYIVKTATTLNERYGALKVREEVFCKEWGNNRSHKELDFDEYDMQFDHLVIIEQKSKQIIGNYRLCCTEKGPFYSETEFEMTNIKALKGLKVEMSRACLLPQYRAGMAFSVLWYGVGEYAKACEASYLLGCSSLKFDNIEQMASIWQLFKNRYFAAEGMQVNSRNKPTEWEECQKLSETIVKDEKRGKILLPPVLRFYLNNGALLGSEAFFDENFGTWDFFTILDIENMNLQKRKKANLLYKV